MKVLVVLLACVILTASAGHLELCGYTMGQLSTVTACIELRASIGLKLRLTQLRIQLNCLADPCMIRKLCAKGELMDVLPQYLSDQEIVELHDVAEVCRP
ncbi:antimicrobial peptide microplusin-like [Dermacentor silvarum]|uniref:antimicrobial peptide microplusin-like n=1 Tax=Dermacentor silvarum TaxID=543639 RepID=UPI002100CAEF|nr:antimicrobial peptide microplusin-like [Dermacentor silvarum]